MKVKGLAQGLYSIKALTTEPCALLIYILDNKDIWVIFFSGI